MESLRTEDGKHFRMSDGTYMAVSYGMAVHVQHDQTRANISSGYVVQGQPGSAYGGASTLSVGWTAWNNLQESQSYLFFHTLPALPAGSVITDAVLQLYAVSFSGVGMTQLTVGAHALTDDWITQNPVDNYFNWVTSLTWTARPVLETENMLDYVILSSAAQNTNVQWDVTELVKEWYLSGTQNRTIALCIDDELQYSSTACANTSFYAWNTTNPPMLAVTYRDQNGIEPYYTYRTINVHNAGTAYIADATGQVKIVKNVASYASTTNPFSMNLVYNSDYFASDVSADYQAPTKMGVENVSMKLGQGWTLDIIQTMKTETIDGETYICYHDGDGTKHYFRKDTQGKDTTGTYYFDEDGLGLKVKITAGAALADDQPKSFVMYDDHGNSWTFTNGRLTQTSNADGNTYTINYSSNKITSVVQTNNGQSSITVAAFTYTGDFVTAITDAAENTYNLGYDSGNRLTSLTYNGIANARYQYTNTGSRIVYMWDSDDMYEADFKYTQGRCSYFCEYDNDVNEGDGEDGMCVNILYSGNTKTTYQYGGNDRRLNTADDLYTTYLFPASIRTLTNSAV